MTTKTKEQLFQWLFTICIFLLAFIVLIPNVEIWNMAYDNYTDIFHVIVSILNLIFGGFMVYTIGKVGFKTIKDKFNQNK